MQVDWDKASEDFGSASVASFKKMIQNAFKKVKDAEAKGNVEATPAKAGAKKRKVANEGDGEALPRKKRGRKAKKEATLAADGLL